MSLVRVDVCPYNDYMVYMNIYNLARELDEVLYEMRPSSTPFVTLRSALMERAGELWKMYAENYAVQQFKEGMQP